MLTRRHFLALSTASLLASRADALAGQQYDGDFVIPDELAARMVRISDTHRPGTIHILTEQRRLYFVVRRGEAMRYSIAVGQEGREFRGTTRIGRKAEWPSWTPTANMIRREPQKYARFAGGVAGGPENPLGARALYLYRGSRDTLYRIHGTSQPWSIGQAGSSGCIRMFNSHVTQLYDMAPIGTRVIAY